MDENTANLELVGMDKKYRDGAFTDVFRTVGTLRAAAAEFLC